MNLSRRLQLIADSVPPDSNVADIACDHGLLGIHLALKGRARNVVCGDLRSEPCNAARANVVRYNCHHHVVVRQGDGLHVLRAGEADVVIAAGVGGRVITHMLSTAPDILGSVNRLILQPQNSEEKVREWLAVNGWALCDEHLLEEAGYIYEILIAERGNARAAYDESSFPAEFLYHTGLHLSTGYPDLFLKKWREQRTYLESIIAELTLSKRIETREKLRQLLAFCTLLDEVMQSTQTTLGS